MLNLFNLLILIALISVCAIGGIKLGAWAIGNNPPRRHTKRRSF